MKLALVSQVSVNVNVGSCTVGAAHHWWPIIINLLQAPGLSNACPLNALIS